MEEDAATPVLNNLHRELTCILFPGIVKNDEKALQCMGGIKLISQVNCQSSKKRLGMSYHVDNPLVKKMYADAQPSSGVLLRLKVKKVKSGKETKREVVSTSVVGCVKKVYKFESMADFQYLPIAPLVPGGSQFKCILDDILPSGTDSLTTIVNPKPIPTFIVPSNFTRSDKTIQYFYTEKRYLTKDIKSESPKPNEGEDIHRMRGDRCVPVVKYSFNLHNDLPTEPNEYYVQQKNMKIAIYPQLEQEFEPVIKMFEERPIWSMNHIRYRTKIKVSVLKIILPCLALYMREGPWRMMWVKYGYDPRKDPEARKYQTLDFRLRHSAGLHTMVVTRDEIVQVKKTDRIRSGWRKTNIDDLTEDIVTEATVRLRPGWVPTQRQIFFQYCDVELPEVEALVSAPLPPGYVCHHKLGWLPPDADNACRDHVYTYAKQALLASYSARLKLEEESSGDDLSSDEEGASSSVVESNE